MFDTRPVAEDIRPTVGMTASELDTGLRTLIDAINSKGIPVGGILKYYG
jgi:hypothetical protein